MNIHRSKAFDLAFRFVTETKLNLFLTGKAGTGKTTFLKYLRQTSNKKILVAAPTGVAAMNAGGVTLHSLFQLPFTPFIPSPNSSNESVNSNTLLSRIKLSKEKLNLLRSMDLLVIDEASMVPSHTVDAIDIILRSVRKNHREPFGGTQLLFIGDLHQLPPVVKNQEWDLLKEYYPSIFFFDSQVLREHFPVKIELTEIYRQSDQKFIEILNQVRNNNLTSANLNLLNSRHQRNTLGKEQSGFVTLVTHNSQADELNLARLKKLPAVSKCYEAELEGDFPEHLFPAKEKLELKVGAQIMFLKNDSEGKKYFNGKIGTVQTLHDDEVIVQCNEEELPILVKRHSWENINYKLNKSTHEITENVTGTFRQFPLRLAWAITIHKSQGLTFNNLVVDAENAFANGQIYVALSRCTSLEGLVLSSPLNGNMLGTHQELLEWQQKKEHEINLDSRLEQARKEFMLQELYSIYSWKFLNTELQEFSKYIRLNIQDLPGNSSDWIKNILEKQFSLQSMGEKFIVQIQDLQKLNSEIEKNEALQKRIKEAAKYFLKEWKDLFLDFTNHPLSTDIRNTALDLNVDLQAIAFLFHEIIHKMKYCCSGFELQSYWSEGRKPGPLLVPIHNAYATGVNKFAVTTNVEHKGLYEMLSNMRRAIAADADMPLYMVFSNKVIEEICKQLPADHSSLSKMKGIGKKKVDTYGDEILQLVSEYCKEKGILANKITKSKKMNIGMPETAEISLKYFLEGQTIQEIADARDLVTGTIETHLASAVLFGKLPIEKCMSAEEAKKLADLFPENLTNISWNTLKSKAPSDVSFGKLRMVESWIRNNRKS